MPVSCIIVGLVRSDALFEQSLATLDRLRSEGHLSRIIISTWNEELRDNPGISGFANKYRCEIVSSPDPGTILYPGSELRSSMPPQTIGLRQALAAIDDDDMVLKTRPDIVLNEDLLRNRLIAAGSSDFNPAPGSPFKKRIWVPGRILPSRSSSPNVPRKFDCSPFCNRGTISTPLSANEPLSTAQSGRKKPADDGLP